jgi:amino acid transporter
MEGTERGLRRRLNLPLLTLYGVGVTIGAGIYVLIGPVAGHAGRHAPLAFVLAGLVMGLTVASYAELCTRFPVAAGEAAYLKAAFGLRSLSAFVGLTMIATGIIASSAVMLGATGYIAQFIDAPKPIVVIAVVLALGLVSAWGILESVVMASVFTVIEVGGLVAIIAAGSYARLPVFDVAFALPSLDAGLWTGIAFASLLAFFAFIGFEDLTNMVEETRNPERTVPAAMALTLIVTTVLYLAVAAIAVTAVPPDRLAASDAPLSIVYREVAGVSPVTISAIAIVATLNTIIAQMTMATRVLYGLARQGDVPRVFGHVNRRTSTPLVATATIVLAVIVLALLIPFERLAEFTSLSTLVVFAFVNLALLKLRWDGGKRKRGEITVPIAAPILGLLSCLVMMFSSLWG